MTTPLCMCFKPSPLPEDLKRYFSDLCVCRADAFCGEPIAWGYRLIIQHRLAEELFHEIGSRYGCWDYVNGLGAWCLITKYLTLEEAKERFGESVEYERGPRGGFKKLRVGNKVFANELLPASYWEDELERQRRQKEGERAKSLPRFTEEGKRLIQELWKKEDDLDKGIWQGAPIHDDVQKRRRELYDQIERVWAYHHMDMMCDGLTDEGREAVLRLQADFYALNHRLPLRDGAPRTVHEYFQRRAELESRFRRRVPAE